MHFMLNNFSPKIEPSVEKYGTARQATDDNIVTRITKATGTHS
jgi:hypothetical protein